MQSESSIRAALELLDRLADSRIRIASEVGGIESAISDHDATVYQDMAQALAWVLGEVDIDPECENGLAEIIRRHTQ